MRLPTSILALLLLVPIVLAENAIAATQIVTDCPQVSPHSGARLEAAEPFHNGASIAAPSDRRERMPDHEVSFQEFPASEPYFNAALHCNYSKAERITLPLPGRLIYCGQFDKIRNDKFSEAPQIIRGWCVSELTSPMPSLFTPESKGNTTTACPLYHPEQKKLRLSGARALETGAASNIASFEYEATKDGRELGQKEFSFLSDAEVAYPMLECRYGPHASTILRLNIQGRLLRCFILGKRAETFGPKPDRFDQAWCESLQSPR